MEEQEIHDLIEKLKSGHLSRDEQKHILAAFQKAEDRKKLLRYFDSSYNDIIDELDKLPENKAKEQVKDRLMKNISNAEYKPLLTSSGKKNRLRWIAAAALLLFGLGIYKYIIFYKQNDVTETEWRMVQTKHGERKRVTLYDKTTVVLNGNTTLYYTGSENNSYRLVKLRGEAFFDVSPDSSRPFVVVTKNFSTLVKGTSFNIDSDISKIVEVSTGIVQVFSVTEANALSCLQKHKKDIATNLTKITEESIKELGSGESITMDLNKPKNSYSNKHNDLLKSNVNLIMNVVKGQKVKLNPNNTLSLSEFNGQVWTNNELVYLNETLSQVATKIYRNYGDSVYVSPELKDKNITITFRNKNKEEVLQTITEISNGKLTKDQTNKNWIITKD